MDGLAQVSPREEARDLAPQVRQILQKCCYDCHGADPKHIEGKLNVLDYRSLVDSTREHRMVVPGSIEKSLLIHRIEDNSMPPEKEDEYPRLSSAEIADLKKWVAGGAPPFPDLATDPLPPEPKPTPLAIEVKKIFAENCAYCHSSEKNEKGIKVLNHDLLLLKRKVIVPGDPDGSKLFQVLITDDEDRIMPPKEEGGKLPSEEIDKVRRWILEGAPPFPRTRAEKRKPEKPPKN